MILLIDNYDSFTWNLVHYLGQLGATVEVHRNDQITVDEAMAKKPRAIVLSPGPCDPDKAGICLDLVERAGETTPILGVCLGHQAIGQIYGGQGRAGALPRCTARSAPFGIRGWACSATCPTGSRRRAITR